MILDPDSAMLLLTLALGAYVQAVTGFALGLVVVGLVAIAGWVPVAVAAAVVTAAALVNVAAALPGRMHQVHWRDSGLMAVGMVPAVFGGLALLGYLSAGLTEALNTVLAVSILAGGVFLTLRPQPRATDSGSCSTLAMGTVGGFLDGLFATGGPPVVYHLYRQPYAVASIRATLLVTFGLACLVRLGLLVLWGKLTPEVLGLMGASIPVVIAATVVGRRFPPPLSDRNMRRLAFTLLVLLGGTLLMV